MKHCLVVDDSAVVRKVARRILEGLSFRVSEAEDGRQGILACQGGMPDAVFLDGTMPVMDGYEFLKELRRMPGGDGPKVVFLRHGERGRADRPGDARGRRRLHAQAVRSGKRDGQVPG